jgi:uncharacterized protein (DUF1800 family)
MFGLKRGGGLRAFLLFAAALGALPPRAASQLPPGASVLSETQRAIHLLSRATYGVRPSDVEELIGLGSAAWLEMQLHPETISDNVLSYVHQASGPPASSSVAAADSALMALVRRLQTPPLMRTVQPTLPRLPSGVELHVAEKLERALHSRRQLEAVMADFWFNHFNVYAGKRGVGATTLGDYERTAIRERVFGRFEDMLLAVAQHAAMLVYLDNYLSTVAGPSSPGGGGINENYARELLELHTLGVDGGYTQQDVIEVARAFTGWSVLMVRRRATGPPEPVGGTAMEFHPEWHDPGAKEVLGYALAPGRGVEDGREVIALLARHPATAKHIATKLVRHFVADDPSADLIDELARVFIETDGDLRDVTRALFTAEAFYRPEHYRAKVKRPFELVASTLRITGAEPESGRAIAYLLNALGHLPYQEPAPTGYSTSAADWMSAGSTLTRVNFALDVGSGRYLSSPIDPWSLMGVQEGEAQMFFDSTATGRVRYDSRAITRGLMERVLYGASASTLETTIAEDLSERDRTDFSGLVVRALGLTLGSPDFQRY